MQPPKIDNSTQEERQAYVLDAWKCLHNCELMEQWEEKPCLLGLSRVATEEDRRSNLWQVPYSQGPWPRNPLCRLHQRQAQLYGRHSGDKESLYRVRIQYCHELICWYPFLMILTRRYSVFNLFLEHRTDDVLSKYPIVGGFVYFS